MRHFAETCEAVGRTTKKNEKVRLVGDYLRSLGTQDAALAAVFFTGSPFPRSEEKVLGVGGSLVWEVVSRLAGDDADTMAAVYRRHGDLGDAAEELLAGRTQGAGLSLSEAAAAFEALAGLRGTSQKVLMLDDLLGRAHPAEAKYIIKIITGDLRIGLKENLVEEALARAFERPLGEVERANMLTGDIGMTLRLAVGGRLAEAQFRLFQPIGFMLASAVESPEEAIEALPDGALLEDKYDGIRAQVHKGEGGVRLFSRTLDEIREFPELLVPLEQLPGTFVLDGEIVAWRSDRALPFTELQKRLGRKQLDLWLSTDVPVSFLAFDLLYLGSELTIDLPLVERHRRLEGLLQGSSAEVIRLASQAAATSAGEVERAFQEALGRGNEGVMVKVPQSPYTPGRRGKAWLKLKRPMATLDVVVTAAEYGHGKRRGLLSDLTFSVRDGERLVTIGKAYSGLTDAEISELTEFFKQSTIEDQGFLRRVEPKIVLEVAFNNIQRSSRHESGYALRFPRIVRLRSDKPASEIDTVDRVKELYAGQFERVKERG